MTILKLLMLLSLIVWFGGLIFFAFVVAPSAFAILPTRHLAGSVVGRTLSALHWMGIVSGIVYLICSLLASRLTSGELHPFATRNLILVLMLLLTLISQFAISPKMHAIRASVVEIDSVPVTDPARVEFNALHLWSERLEKGVFFLGLGLLYATVMFFS
jgi:uncharacterized membrane protein